MSANGQLMRFPREHLRRFVAVQFVHPDSWRAAVFVGWHVDPARTPSKCFASYAEAAAVAKRGAQKMGLPLVRNRCSVPRYGVWESPGVPAA